MTENYSKLYHSGDLIFSQMRMIDLLSKYRGKINVKIFLGIIFYDVGDENLVCYDFCSKGLRVYPQCSGNLNSQRPNATTLIKSFQKTICKVPCVGSLAVKCLHIATIPGSELNRALTLETAASQSSFDIPGIAQVTLAGLRLSDLIYHDFGFSF
jgi:hypothetical protein